MTDETNREEHLDDEILEGEIIEEGVETETAPLQEQVEQLTKELEAAQEQARNYFEGWQRERADFANYKKRIERDQRTLSQNITGEVVKKYLTVLDDLDRALKNRPVEGTTASWANGIELIQRKLQNILESEGVQRMDDENGVFDPNRHEAVSYEESPEHDSGHIIEILQQGYTLGERVLRPAVVRVAR